MEFPKVLFWVHCCFHFILHHLAKSSAFIHILNSTSMRMTHNYTSISPIRMPLLLPAHSSEKSLADMFASYFTNKISKIGDTFPTSGSFNDAPESVPPAFNTFKPVTEDEVSKCIKESPTQSCQLDPIPTFLLKDCLDILLLSITKLVNYALIDGSFPSAFKRAVVTPLIKKASLPRNDLKNYRLVSGLCFLSKLVERVVAKQLTSHINDNKLDNQHQSAYKPGHSTETALLPIKMMSISLWHAVNLRL